MLHRPLLPTGPILRYLIPALMILAGCGGRQAAISGVVVLPEGKTAGEVQISLRKLGDSLSYSIRPDADGSWASQELPQGSYLRIATMTGVAEGPLATLRSVALHAGELRQLSGYDAVSDMTDELKAAIAFGKPDAVGSCWSHADSLAAMAMERWPPSMRNLMPQQGPTAVRMATLGATEGRQIRDTVFFDRPE